MYIQNMDLRIFDIPRENHILTLFIYYFLCYIQVIISNNPTLHILKQYEKRRKVFTTMQFDNAKKMQ